jgi:glycosyltransferase involved in cell wall biosynthesis
MLGEVGLYAQMGSADDLADQLALALDDRALAARLAIAGRARAVSDFSWEQGARHIEAIYRQVLDKRYPHTLSHSTIHTSGDTLRQ